MADFPSESNLLPVTCKSVAPGKVISGPVKLLLINPKFPESFWSMKWTLTNILTSKKAINPPLGLATLAALCPDDWQVEIIDENIESIPLNPDVDIVGVCGMGVQLQRQTELLSHFRENGYFTVAGGSYASLCPEEYPSFADAVISGEAEYIWPRFCQDFLKGRINALYKETGTVDITLSPTPRFDLLKLHQYTSVSMQFSRGCPYRCEFCDIIVMFGRKPRMKTIGQIERELDVLREYNVRSVFFVDDNFIGNQKEARKLMVFLEEYQDRHNYQFRFGTEATVNLASNPKMLDQFKRANFAWVFLGIETPDEAALKETKKTQNMKIDLLESVRRFYQSGIDVLAGFIIGFDSDNMDSFGKQKQFIQLAGIQVAMIGLLTALPKTPLYIRLQKEGRLVAANSSVDNTKLATNVIPKQMTYQQMINAYQALVVNLYKDKNMFRRIINKMRYYSVADKTDSYSFKQKLFIIKSVISRGVLKGGSSRIFYFISSLARTSPKKWSIVFQEWITALSMRDYLDRHYQNNVERDSKIADNVVRLIRRLIPDRIHKSPISLAACLSDLNVNVQITIKGYCEKRLYISFARQLKKLLKKTASTVTLRIEDFYEVQRKQFERMLNMLAKYGDRVFIYINSDISALKTTDLSRFNIVLK